MPCLATHLVFFWVALAGFLLLGAVLRRWVPPFHALNGPYATMFFSLCLGLIAFSMLAATYYTGGRTLLLAAAIPLAGLMRRESPTLGAAFEPRATEPPARRTTIALELGLAGTLYFAAVAVPLWAPGGSPLGIRVPHPDVVFFGLAGDSLTRTGLETIYPYANLYSTEAHGRTPYHYQELWLAAGLARMLKEPTVVSYSLLAVPLLAVAVLTGLWAIVESLGTVSTGAKLALALLPFCPAPRLGTMNDLLSGSTVFLASPFPFTPKTLTFTALLIAGAVMALHGRMRAAVCMILAMIPLSVLAAPSAAFLAAAITLLFARRKDVREWRLSLALLLLTVIALLAFYAVFGDRVSAFASVDHLALANLNPATFRTKVNIVGKSCLQIALAYCGPILAAGFLLWRSSRRADLACLSVAAGLFALGGVLGCAAVSTQLLAQEFAIFPVSPAVYVLLVSLFAGWQRDPVPKWVLLTALVAVGAWGLAGEVRQDRAAALRAAEGTSRLYTDRYTTGYLREIAQLRLSRPQGGFLVANEDIGDPWDQEKPLATLMPTNYTLGAYVAFLPSLAAPTMLGTFETTHQNASLCAVAPFYRYAAAARASGVGDREILGDYLRKMKLAYVVATATAEIPTEVAARALRWIVDPGTGERFIVLRETASNGEKAPFR
jgi:hypothetical protein